MPARTVVIGGGAGGIGAEAASRAADPSGEVMLFSQPSARVTGIDLARRQVAVDGQGDIGWDRLVIATGSDFADPPVPGPRLRARPPDGGWLAGLHQAHSLGQIIDGDGVLDEVKVAVVVGGSPLGVELATALAERGIDTHLIESGPRILAEAVDPDIAAPLDELWAEMGVKLHCNAGLEEVLGGESGRVRAVRTAEGELPVELPADLVVICTKKAPRSDLAAAAGIEIGPTGGIVVDDRMATSAAGVWAAGGCAELAGRVSPALPQGWPALPQGWSASHAHAQGKVAGTNAAGTNTASGRRTYRPGYVPWVVAAGQAIIGGVSFGETQAQSLGLPYVLGRAMGISRARYYPGMHKITVKLLAEPGSLRLIGAQMVGGEGIKERVDFLATATRVGVTLHDLAYMENVYSPPIGALNEPIALAAQNGLANLT